jgi:hypothetical protein
MYSLKKIYEKNYLSAPTIFQSLMGLGKSRCDILHATTQGNLPPFIILFFYHLLTFQHFFAINLVQLGCL